MIMSLYDYIKFIDYNYIRGYEYEQYVLGMLHKFYDIEEIYLWKNVPYYLLLEASIIFEDDSRVKYKFSRNDKSMRLKVLLDTGIDIIAKLKNKDILLVQCKCYQNRCISQKTLGGFYRILLDALMYNKNNKKKSNIYGIIVHNNYLSDIITASYSYKKNIVRDLYIPFEGDSCNFIDVQGKLKKYKDIAFSINLIFLAINIICFIFIVKY